MDFLFSVLGGFFIALLLAVALTFGFVLLMWFMGVALAVAACVMLRDLWRRWYFLRRATPRREDPKVIEAEYEDISPGKWGDGMLRYRIALGLALLSLTACGPEKKDYTSQATCEDKGYKPGTAELQRCMQDEKTAQMMEEQRREYDQMKQDQQDWSLRHY